MTFKFILWCMFCGAIGGLIPLWVKYHLMKNNPGWHDPGWHETNNKILRDIIECQRFEAERARKGYRKLLEEAKKAEYLKAKIKS